MNKRVVAGIIAIVSIFTFAACSSSQEARKGGETAKQEQQAVQTSFNKVSSSQPIPVFDWSQERQTVIDTETIRATGTISTTAGYLEGIGLIWWCPSSGAPVPSTYQLSGSTQYADIPGDDTKTIYPIDQGEPTGVYIGASSGTWTLCLDDNGKKFAKYWEGYVDSTIGVVTSYPADKRIRIEQATFEFTENPDAPKGK